MIGRRSNAGTATARRFLAARGSHRAVSTVLLATALCALAAFSATLFVPPAHIASLVLKNLAPEPAVVERVQRTALEEAQATLAVSPIRHPGLGELDAALSHMLTKAFGPGFGTRAPQLQVQTDNGIVAIRAEAPDEAAARAIAERAVDLLTKDGAQAPNIGSAEAEPAWEEIQVADDRVRETERALADAERAEDVLARDARERLAEERRTAEADLARLRSRSEALQAMIPELEQKRLPPDAEALADPTGWQRLRAVLEQRDTVAEQLQALRRTLLENHPRVVTTRLRLSDLEGQVDEQAARLIQEARERAQGIDRTAAQSEARISALREQEREAEAASTRIAGLRGELAGRREVLRRLGSAEPVRASTDRAGSDEVSRSTIVTETRPVDPWPATLAGGAFGFVLSLLGVAIGRLLRPASVPRRSSPRTNFPVDVVSATNERGELVGFHEVVDGILLSDLQRVVLLSPGNERDRPVSVDLARNLALRGRRVALLDLTEEQRAARAMGVPAGTRGLDDTTTPLDLGDLMQRDFATSADIVPTTAGAGPWTPPGCAALSSVIAHLERGYETLIIDCAGLEPNVVKALADPEAALLAPLGCLEATGSRDFLRNLEMAGLGDLIVMDDRRRF